MQGCMATWRRCVGREDVHGKVWRRRGGGGGGGGGEVEVEVEQEEEEQEQEEEGGRLVELMCAQP